MINAEVKRIDASDCLYKEISLRCDLAGEYPVYIYKPGNGKYLCFSKSLKKLLDSDQVVKPLSISEEGLSFILQSGSVPPPWTIYVEIFVVGIGDSVDISCENERLKLEFKHFFPFPNSGRPVTGPDEIQSDTLLELLASATVNRIDESRPSFLFQSAGKDSNVIVVALAEAGWQDRVTLVTYRSLRPNNDEADVARSIARKLGFKHRILELPQHVDRKLEIAITEFVSEMPIMCQDMQIAYPVFCQQLNFRGSNLIDGLGNDVYIGYISSAEEYRKALWFSGFGWLRCIPYADLVPIVRQVSRTRAERTGFPGLPFSISKRIYKTSANVYPFWKRVSDDRKHWDYIDFRGDIRGTMTDAHVFVQKIRNASYVYDCNLILPWTDSSVAQYVYSLPEKFLFDRDKRRNKILLRKILLEKVHLDSDALGKKVFGFTLGDLWQDHVTFFMKEIANCKYWSNEVVSIMDRLSDLQKMDVFFLSAWLNNCKYLK